MQVVLKVVGGKNDGREIVISVPKFIIGRGESAHLRPSSDLISREHCSISIKDGQVTIDDMNSSNGTFVNGEQLTGTHLVKAGDSLRVDRLQFNILIDPLNAGNKNPTAKSAVEAGAAHAGSRGEFIEGGAGEAARPENAKCSLQGLIWIVEGRSPSFLCATHYVLSCIK